VAINHKPALRSKEAAAYLGTAGQTPAAWRMLGKGPAYFRVGRSVFYYVEDLDAYLAKTRVDPEAATASRRKSRRRKRAA
jgi:hypothetical protein